MIIFDENDEKERLVEKLRYFYEDFSSDVRRKLMSRNLQKINTAYDILYNNVREKLLAKNVPSKIFDEAIEDRYKLIRDALIAKTVVQETDMDNISKLSRESLLARNKIKDSVGDLQQMSTQIRKTLLAKNTYDKKEFDQDGIRRQNISKNVSTIHKIEGEAFRESLLAKNKPIINDLLQSSEYIRKINSHKNVAKNTDLKEMSDKFRQSLIAKNSEAIIGGIDEISPKIRQSLLSRNKQVSINIDANSIREKLLSKNVVSNKDLLALSEDFRKNSVSKNVPLIPTDNSKEFRQNNVSKNSPIEYDIESMSKSFRDSSLSKNVKNEGDLLSKSIEYRKSIIAKITKTDNDILKQSNAYREDLLSKNKQIINHIDYDSVRNSLLSKNDARVTDILLESESFRKNNLSKLKESAADILKISDGVRQSALSKNKPIIQDLLEYSKKFRSGIISRNFINGDLLKDSQSYRDNLISKNKSSSTDLLSTSNDFRTKLLSMNKSNITDIKSMSDSFRNALISMNKPEFTDLMDLSSGFRSNLIKMNVARAYDILLESTQLRNNLLATNVPRETDLLSMSTDIRNDLLATNVPRETDLLSMSTDIRNDLLASNVPRETDLLSMSTDIRDDLLATNVPRETDLLSMSSDFRDDLLATNVPRETDLLSMSEDVRDGLLASNVPRQTDLLSMSSNLRDDLLAKNKEKNTNLLNDSKVFRDNLISKNGGGLLGVNIGAGGTSTFLGISRVMVQGLIYRNLLLAKNKRGQQRSIITREENMSGRKESINKNVVGYEVERKALQEAFGITPQSFTKDIDLGGGAMDTTTIGGGVTYNGSYGASATIQFSEGYVTKNARKMNLQRNSFILNGQVNGYQSGAMDAVSNLGSYNFGGFQNLIEKTIGSFSKFSTYYTNSTPESIVRKLESNGGGYLNGGSTASMLKPGFEDAEIGSVASMMAKTVPGNPLDEVEFRRGERGVRHIMNKIKSAPSSVYGFSENFDVQKQKVFIIGKNSDGTNRKAKQKYTIENQYAPKGAETLHFMLENYSIGTKAEGSVLHLPPYIKSLNLDHTANWNAITFLGRPEPVYTYNNAKRSGSISFIILTDFSQDVEIGTDWETLEKISYNFDGTRFNNFDKSRNSADIEYAKAEINRLNKLIAENENDLSLNEQSGAPEISIKRERVNKLKSQRDAKQQQLDGLTSRNSGAIYSEQSATGENVYANISDNSNEDGYIVTKIGDTKSRLDKMKKNLMFQPAFFSGDKDDYVDRMEFIAKMTLPSENTSTGGFSFINPPVCHIHLGNLLNHDIIVNSISYSFDELIWTMDGGPAYPIYTTVNMGFDIVGPYRHGSGTVSSTMKGGIFRDKQVGNQSMSLYED